MARRVTNSFLILWKKLLWGIRKVIIFHKHKCNSVKFMNKLEVFIAKRYCLIKYNNMNRLESITGKICRSRVERIMFIIESLPPDCLSRPHMHLEFNLSFQQRLVIFALRIQYIKYKAIGNCLILILETKQFDSWGVKALS